MDDYSNSSMESLLGTCGLIIQAKNCSDPVALKKELARIRLERQQAQSKHEDECKHYKGHLDYLKTRFRKQLKHAASMSTYRRILNDADSNTTRYVVEIQAQVLCNFHWTEIYRNQWELTSNHLIDMTRFFMHNQTLLKDETKSAQIRLMEISGSQSTPVIGFKEEEPNHQKSMNQRHRRRSLDMIQQTFTSTIQQAKDKWSAVSTIRGAQVQPIVVMQHQQKPWHATEAF